MDVLNNQRHLASADKVPTIYLGNHDHSHVTWQAGARDNAGAMRWVKTQPWAIALFTAPATPMVQNGQEFGEDHWIPEDDHGTGRRVLPRPLRWKQTDDPIGRWLLRLHARLIAIRNTYPGLRSANCHPPAWADWMTRPDADGFGVDVERQLLVFHRWGEAASIVGMAITGSNSQVYAFYSDGTRSVGKIDDLDYYSAPVAYTLPGGRTPADIVGVAIAKSNDHVYAWYRDGMMSAGTSLNLGAYIAPRSYTLPPGRTPSDIVGVAIGAGDRVRAWYRDGYTTAGWSRDLDLYEPPKLYTRHGYLRSAWPQPRARRTV